MENSTTRGTQGRVAINLQFVKKKKKNAVSAKFNKMKCKDVLDGPVVKNLPASVEDMGSMPGPGDPTCHVATKPVHHNY